MPQLVPTSAEHLIELLNGAGPRLDYNAQNHALRALINERDCPWCGVRRGALCLVNGGDRILRRTHPVRLAVWGDHLLFMALSARRAAERDRASA